MIGRWFWILAPLLWSSAAFSDDIDDCNASGDNARAIKGCTSLINGGNLNRRNALRAFEHRASAYTETGDIDAAIADYTMSIEFNPTAEMSYDFRGRLHGKKADYVAAITDLTKSLELKPSIFAYADRAEIYEKMGDYARAIADYTKALELDPDATFGLEFYTKRADAFMAPGDYKSAATDYTSAIDADPKHVQLSDRSSTTADLFDRRAIALLRAGQTADALHDSEHSLALWPGEPSALTTHGRILEALGRRDEAIGEFQRALTNVPTTPTPRPHSPSSEWPPSRRMRCRRYSSTSSTSTTQDNAGRRQSQLARNTFTPWSNEDTASEAREYAFALDVLRRSLHQSEMTWKGRRRAARQVLLACPSERYQALS